MKRNMVWVTMALGSIALVLIPSVATAKVWTAKSVSELIADINAANQAGGSNTIVLAAGKTFTLTAVDNTTDGANGLPVIAANNKLTILGNGATIAEQPGTRFPRVRRGRRGGPDPEEPDDCQWAGGR